MISRTRPSHFSVCNNEKLGVAWLAKLSSIYLSQNEGCRLADWRADSSKDSVKMLAMIGGSGEPMPGCILGLLVEVVIVSEVGGFQTDTE